MEETTETLNGGYSALPGVIREMIKTPGFKEMVNMHLREINPDNARELVKVLLWEDTGFSLGALGSMPGLANWVVALLTELGLQLEKFPTLMLKNFLTELGRDFDTESAAQLPAAYAPLIDRLVWDDPEVVNHAVKATGALIAGMLQVMGGATRKLGQTADFGKIRVGLTEYFEGRRAALDGEWDIFDPVMLANLLGTAPSLLNYILRIVARTLAGLNLPAEVLANAIFQLLEDLDPKEIGGLLDSLAAFVNTLHAGNLVLGRDEPKFKEVLTRVGKNVYASTDRDQLKRMAIALGEDGKVIGDVLAEYFFSTPERTASLARGIHIALNHGIRMAATGTTKFSELPAPVLARMAADLESEFEARELGKVINSLVVFTNKLAGENPDLISELLRKMLGTVDIAQCGTLAKTVILSGRDAALADPGISALLQPEAIGGAINTGLTAFNRYSALKPEAIGPAISDTLAAVDPAELNKAATILVRQVVDAMLANTAILKAVVKPIIGGCFRFAKGSVMNLKVVRKLKRKV
ncbi:MAG: hypothetical protein ACYC55_09760 [Candidatus Geothermincolia bacterium]